MAALGPFRFDRRDSALRGLNPLSKLAALLALSLGASLGAGALLFGTGLAALGALVLAGAFRPRVLAGLAELRRDGRFLLPLGLFVALLRVLDLGGPPFLRPSELPGAALYLLRLTLVFALAEAFFRSTTSAELAASLSGAARRLLGRKDLDPGLYLSLAVGFIPRAFAAYEAAREAALARGFDGYGPRGGRGPRVGPLPRGARAWGGGRARLGAELLLLSSFLARSLRGALATAEALEARGYRPGRSLLAPAFRAIDGLVCAGAGLLALAALLLG